MHVLLALLGTIVTILYMLHRLAEMGVSLGGLNPFLWRRRRAWRKRYEADPLFALEDPLDVAAILAVATAKADGDMSAAERAALLREFETTFQINARRATELLTSSAHMLGDGQLLREKLDDVLAKVKDRFNEAQLESALGLLERVASMNGVPSALQRELIDRIRTGLDARTGPKGLWA